MDDFAFGGRDRFVLVRRRNRREFVIKTVAQRGQGNRRSRFLFVQFRFGSWQLIETKLRHMCQMAAAQAVLTEEWTPLEPGVLDRKYYVRGIGTVLEQTVKGGDERNTLVAVRRG